MENLIIKSNETRKRKLETDNSDYFSKWGSRNPMLTVREEIDNQISAMPRQAGILIQREVNGKCTIKTFNDGITPTPERMEKMNCIGKTHSDRRGASICGVGQIEGLVAGRKSPTWTGDLHFKSVHGGQVSEFNCKANGLDYTITTVNSGPFPTDEQDCVEKTYSGMKDFSDDELKELKVLAAIKIYPYAKKNPDFTYTINGEKIKPFGVLYEGVKNKAIKRMEVKDYVIKYHGKEYTVSAGAVDVARYVKPDGWQVNENNADELDSLYKMAPQSGGVFVEIGDVNVITGGKDSWRFIGKNYHTTHNGQRIWIRIPAEGELKDAIFAESPNKSSVSICLNEITDGEKHVFKDMLEEIIQNLNLWSKERDKSNKDGKTIEVKKEKEIIARALSNSKIRASIKDICSTLSIEEINVLGKKKFKTIVQGILKEDGVNVAVPAVKDKNYKRQNRAMSEDTKKKLSKSLTNRRLTKTHREHISQSLKDYWSQVPAISEVSE